MARRQAGVRTGPARTARSIHPMRSAGSAAAGAAIPSAARQDQAADRRGGRAAGHQRHLGPRNLLIGDAAHLPDRLAPLRTRPAISTRYLQTVSASCRDRGCRLEEIAGVAGSITNKTI